MACDIDDREGESPSPMEPRLGRMFHSSATGRRREQTLPEALGPRQAVQSRDETAGSAGSEAGTTRSDAAHRTSIPSPARLRDTNSRTDRVRGDGRPSQNALRFKILRCPQPPGGGAHNGCRQSGRRSDGFVDLRRLLPRDRSDAVTLRYRQQPDCISPSRPSGRADSRGAVTHSLIHRRPRRPGVSSGTQPTRVTYEW
jgi:hypothetical protein